MNAQTQVFFLLSIFYTQLVDIMHLMMDFAKYFMNKHNQLKLIYVRFIMNDNKLTVFLLFHMNDFHSKL